MEESKSQELLNKVYESLCNFALRVLDEKNTSGYGLSIIPEVIDKILRIKPMV